MSKIFVTGGSGFIGSHFQEKYPQDQLVIYDLKKPEFPFPSASVAIQGDVRDFESVKKAMQGCDVILHLAAAHHDFGIEREEYFSVNENGTQQVCNAAAELGIKKIIFYSSVAVYGDTTEPTDDNTSPAPVRPYGESKLAGEKVLNNWAQQDSDRCVLVIRPTVVYGPRNLANMYFLIRQINSGMYFNIGKGDNIKSIAYVENLVLCTLFLINKMKPGVLTLNYTDEPHLSSRVIADEISRHLGRNKNFTIPLWVAVCMAFPFDILIAITRKNLPISVNRVRKICTPTHHTSPGVLKHGFVKKYTNYEGLKKMTEWYNQAFKK